MTGFVSLGLFTPASSCSEFEKSEVIFEDLEASVYNAEGSKLPEASSTFDFLELQAQRVFLGNDWTGTTTMTVADGNLILSVPPNPHVRYANAIFNPLFTLEPGHRLEFRTRVVRASTNTAAILLFTTMVGNESSAMQEETRNHPALSPDGSLIASRTDLRSFDLRRTRDGEQIMAPLDAGAIIGDLEWSPSGHLLAVGTYGGIRMFDPESGTFRSERYELAGRRVAFSPDGVYLVGATHGLIRAWALDTGDFRDLLSDAGTSYGPLPHIEVSPDSRHLLGITGDRHVRVWDLRSSSGSPLFIELEDKVLVAGFGSDGGTVLAIDDRNQAHLLDARTGKRLIGPLPHSAHAGLPKMSPDARYVLTVADRPGACLWDLHAVNPNRITIPPAWQTIPVAYNADRTIEARIIDRYNLRFVNLNMSEPPGIPPIRTRRAMYQTCFVPDNPLIVIEYADGFAQLWNYRLGEAVSPLVAPEYSIGDLQPQVDLSGPEPLETDDLFTMGQVLAMSELDSNNLPRLLSFDRVRRIRAGAGFGESLGDEATQIQWHDRQAERYEQEWRWFEAEFHLRRLAKLRVEDAVVLARLERAHKAMRQAQSDSNRLGTMPSRLSSTPVECLDLSELFDASIKRDPSGGEAPGPFSELPSGLRILAGIPFDIRGWVRLVNQRSQAGQEALAWEHKITVDQAVTRLHLLHSSAARTPIGAAIVDYRVEYVDGTARDFRVFDSRDVRHYKSAGDFTRSTVIPSELESRVAWVGHDTASSGGPVSVMISSWTNPHPERKVQSLHIGPCSGGRVDYLLFAITAE